MLRMTAADKFGEGTAIPRVVQRAAFQEQLQNRYFCLLEMTTTENKLRMHFEPEILSVKKREHDLLQNKYIYNYTLTAVSYRT